MIDSNINKNLKLGAYLKNNGEYSLLTVEHITDGDYKNILYKNINGEIITEISMNIKTGKLSIPNSNNNKYAAKGCGQAVSDCIADAYVNHGWASVASWLLTMYNPGFGVGIAAGCVIQEC